MLAHVNGNLTHKSWLGVDRCAKHTSG